ncbi:MAG: NfeD family protein [Myxococcota bacterium]|nr:NfeD family protein [Myxococcota bacterium]
MKNFAPQSRRLFGVLGLLLVSMTGADADDIQTDRSMAPGPKSAVTTSTENTNGARHSTAESPEPVAPMQDYAARKAKALPRPKLETPAPPVVIIPIQGTIDMGLPAFIARSLDEAPRNAILIFNVDTFGGRVDAAVKIRDAVLAAPQATVAYINRRAISAGALISLAADFIVFAPGGSMGAATPVNMQGGQTKSVSEKMVSYMRSEMRATAEANGRDGRLAEAMVDADSEISGVVPQGKLLTVTTDEALELGLASAQVQSMDELVQRLVGPTAAPQTMTINWAERMARFLTDPTVSGLLMSLGMLGLLLELYTPGFGLAGGLGMLCLGFFFGGHGVAHLAGWEELTLFGTGVAALGIELFVLPGFGIAGVLGLGLIGTSLVLAMLGMPVETAWTLGLLESTLTVVVVSLGLSLLGFVICLRFLPSTPLGRWLILTTQLTGSAHDESGSNEPGHSAGGGQQAAIRIGAIGQALTDIRPTGKMQLDDHVVDVMSQGGWIPKGARLRIIDIEAFRTTVIAIGDAGETQGSDESVPTLGAS